MRGRGEPGMGAFARLRLANREQCGQAVLEMALTLPLFLLAAFGMFQYSLVLFTYCNATYACRNAGRYASLHSSASLAPCTPAQIQTMVTGSLFLKSTLVPSVTVSYVTLAGGAGSNTVGNLVTVSATWSQTVTVPFMAANSFSLSTQNFQAITR